MRRIELRVEPLDRSLLNGVRDPDHDAQRTSSGVSRIPVDVGIVPWFEDERPLKGLAAFLDWRSNGKLSSLIRSEWCVGKTGESVLLPWHRGVPIRRLVLVGLGPLARFDGEVAQAAVQRAVATANALDPDSALFAMPGGLRERDMVELLFIELASAIERGVGRPTASARAPALTPAPEPEDGATDEVRRDDDSVALDEPPRIAELHPAPERWWVVADDGHVARLRRLLEGPPRAAES